MLFGGGVARIESNLPQLGKTTSSFLESMHQELLAI